MCKLQSNSQHYTGPTTQFIVVITIVVNNNFYYTHYKKNARELQLSTVITKTKTLKIKN